MSRNRFKMFSYERISFLFLIAALCAWASVTMCHRTRNDKIIEIPAVNVSDTLTTDSNDSTKIVVKKERPKRSKSKSNKAPKQKQPVPHRDHLHEPVSGF